MNIKNNPSQTSFQAKFLYSDSLHEIAEYAVQQGKFKELNIARKALEAADSRTRLMVDICYTGNKPTIIFTHYVPAPKRSGMFQDAFIMRKQTDYISKYASENPLKYALRQIINLSKQGPNSRQYREIFIKKAEKNTSIWI